MRVEGWEGRLAALVEARRHVPFQWGVHDCVLFAADAVLAVTGVDPVSDVRGQYDSEASGRALLATHDAQSRLYKIVLRRLGRPVHPRAAHRGDVVYGTWGEHGGALGVVLGEVVAAPGPAGLMFMSRRHIALAWAVGRNNA